MDLDPKRAQLKVGLEIHQQIASAAKLFCACPIVKSEELPYSFERRLRPSQSELGGIDPAALFEFSKGKSNFYRWSPESSCMVEADEEPPHPTNPEALETALLVARQLHSNVVDEIHFMRKMVIDGSNTGGFQRTAVVALGGRLDVGGERVGVQTVTLEEDACRILGEDEGARNFALDRLGVPLVEIALDPVTALPERVEEVAARLGRVLRETGRVARGLGTIRQDLNVSVMGGRVVEVKGVQKLNLIAKVVAYEAARQLALVEVAGRLKERGVSAAEVRAADVTGLLRGTGCKTIVRQVSAGGKVVCLSAEGFAGLFGLEPSPGFRLGKELAEVARAHGLGGVVHSDEFVKQGVSKEEESALRAELGAGEGAGLVLVAGPAQKADAAAASVASRLGQATEGVPAETRAATDEGETRFMRPRPGAQRMYPETDVPDATVGAQLRRKIEAIKVETWESRVGRLQGQPFGLSEELALQVYDAGRAQELEELAGSLKRTAPSVVAAALVEWPVRYSREFKAQYGGGRAEVEVLRALDRGEIAKEAGYEMMAALVGGKAASVREAAEMMRLAPLGAEELAAVVEQVVRENRRLVDEKGEAAFSALMGEVMKEARGRADGQLVSRLLKERLARPGSEKT